MQLRFGRREELLCLEKIVRKSPIKVNKNRCCCRIEKQNTESLGCETSLKAKASRGSIFQWGLGKTKIVLLKKTQEYFPHSGIRVSICTTVECPGS